MVFRIVASWDTKINKRHIPAKLLIITTCRILAYHDNSTSITHVDNVSQRNVSQDIVLYGHFLFNLSFVIVSCNTKFRVVKIRNQVQLST